MAARRSSVSGGCDRREFLRTAASGLAAIPAAWPQAGGAPTDARPNILFVLTDDQRWDALGCAGNVVIQTPVLDRMARDGVRFERAFVTTPICAASRASILTGLYERTHRYTFEKPPLPPSVTAATYPFLLRQAGYRTGFVGKAGVAFEKGSERGMFDVFQPSVLPFFQDVGGERVYLTDLRSGRRARAGVHAGAIDCPPPCGTARGLAPGDLHRAPLGEPSDPPNGGGADRVVEVHPLPRPPGVRGALRPRQRRVGNAEPRGRRAARTAALAAATRLRRVGSPPFGMSARHGRRRAGTRRPVRRDFHQGLLRPDRRQRHADGLRGFEAEPHDEIGIVHPVAVSDAAMGSRP